MSKSDPLLISLRDKNGTVESLPFPERRRATYLGEEHWLQPCRSCEIQGRASALAVPFVRGVNLVVSRFSA